MLMSAVISWHMETLLDEERTATCVGRVRYRGSNGVETHYFRETWPNARQFRLAVRAADGIYLQALC